MGFAGDDGYQITCIKAMECGKSSNRTAYKDISEEYARTNTCDVDFIASPDNVAFIPEHNQLLIAEDTCKHMNNVIWSRDMKTGKLTRIFSTPVGAGTGPCWFPNVDGHACITAIIQHTFSGSVGRPPRALTRPRGTASATLAPSPSKRWSLPPPRLHQIRTVSSLPK